MKPTDSQDASSVSVFEIIHANTIGTLGKYQEIVIGPLKGLGDQKFVPVSSNSFDGKGFCILGKFSQITLWSPVKDYVCSANGQSFFIESQKEHEKGIMLTVIPITGDAGRMFKLAMQADEIPQRRKLARKARASLRHS